MDNKNLTIAKHRIDRVWRHFNVRDSQYIEKLTMSR